MLCPDHRRVPAHRLPDSQGGGVHIKQPDLVAAFAALAVDTHRSQKPGLPGLNQPGPDAEGGRIANILNLICILSDDLIIQRVLRTLRVQAE